MNKAVKILVIEHNEEDISFIQRVFSLDKGIKSELIFAEKIAQALDLLKSNDFDLIMLNLALPDLSGIRIFEEILDKYTELPVIILSNPADEAIALEAVRKGAQDYIIKSETDFYPIKRIINCSIERNRLRINMAQLSITDELTKLYNRRGFFIMTQQQLALARRLCQPVGFFFIDIDGMKDINDFWGHHQGDQALIDVSKILRESCRATDVIGRIGGDEFAISFIKEMNCIENIENRIRNKIELHNKSRLQKHMLSVSIGCYCINVQGCVDIQRALAEADKIMYLEKNRKKCLYRRISNQS